jgi:hypothetical protein
VTLRPQLALGLPFSDSAIGQARTAPNSGTMSMENYTRGYSDREHRWAGGEYITDFNWFAKDRGNPDLRRSGSAPNALSERLRHARRLFVEAPVDEIGHRLPTSVACALSA